MRGSEHADQIVDRYPDMFKQIATEAMKIMQQDKKVTLSTRAVRTAYVISLFRPSGPSATNVLLSKDLEC